MKIESKGVLLICPLPLLGRLRVIICIASAPSQKAYDLARTCIICGDPAGSREHIFPAALGGRRTNKGIYCGPHNEGFSPLAAVLSKQLELINALLSVRPDDADGPRSTVLKGPDGNTIRLSGNAIEAHASAAPPEVKEGEGQSLSFASDAKADAWIAEQRAKGYDVRITDLDPR